MTRQQKRFALVGVVLAIAGLAVTLTLTALKQSVAYFYTPSELAALAEEPTTAIRLGGLVEPGSVAYEGSGGDDKTVSVSFTVTDGGSARKIVHYVGVLPDLFREGQGVVVQGTLMPNPSGSILNASTVLAKHDETYMPKELADALKEQGRWQEQGQYGGQDQTE